MKTDCEREFVDFICWLSGAIVTKLEKHCPDLKLKSGDRELFESGMDSMISGAVSDWTVHLASRDTSKYYDDLSVILYIHLFGLLNKCENLANIDRPRFIFLYLSFLDRVLSHETVARRLEYFAEKLMLVRVA